MTERPLAGILLIVLLGSGCAGGSGIGGYDPSQNPAIAIVAARTAFPQQATTPCKDGALGATWKCGPIWCDSELNVQARTHQTTDFYRCWVHHPDCEGACVPTGQVCVIGRGNILHVSKRRTRLIRKGEHVECPTIREERTPQLP